MKYAFRVVLVAIVALFVLLFSWVYGPLSRLESPALMDRQYSEVLLLHYLLAGGLTTVVTLIVSEVLKVRLVAVASILFGWGVVFPALSQLSGGEPLSEVGFAVAEFLVLYGGTCAAVMMLWIGGKMLWRRTASNKDHVEH